MRGDEKVSIMLATTYITSINKGEAGTVFGRFDTLEGKGISPIKVIREDEISSDQDLLSILTYLKVETVVDYDLGWALGRCPTSENFCVFSLEEYTGFLTEAYLIS